MKAALFRRSGLGCAEWRFFVMTIKTNFCSYGANLIVIVVFLKSKGGGIYHAYG
jgi:hypothetical protein